MQRLIRRTKRVLVRVALILLCLASAESLQADSKIYQDVLRSTGLVEVPRPEGRVTYGTCWLVDDKHRLALTSQHVVKNAAEVVVYFPSYRDDTAIPELAHYHRQVAAVHGRVVHRDSHRDLTALQLDSLPDHVKVIPLAARSAGPGDTVHAVGNSGVLMGKLWRYTAGKVRSVYEAEILTDNSLLKARIIETQSPFNGGDSGGPLVNDSGELVGVVIGTQKETRLVSFNVDVSEVRAFLEEAVGPKPQPAAGAPLDRESPPVQGSWKVTLITLEGEQQSGEARFGADGTFTLTTQAVAGAQTRQGRYSYANGVLLMAWDHFEVREALHWVKDRRFTFLSDEMLIFDRPPDAGASTDSYFPKVSTSECSPRTTAKTNGPPAPIGDQALANGPWRPFPSGLVHRAEGPSTDWALATLLISAVGLLLLLGIRLREDGHPTNSTDARTWEAEKGAARGLFRDRYQTGA